MNLSLPSRESCAVPIEHGSMAAAAAAKEVAMRRWFVLMVMVTASLGWIGLVAPAQAKVPGPNGQIPVRP